MRDPRYKHEYLDSCVIWVTLRGWWRKWQTYIGKHEIVDTRAENSRFLQFPQIDGCQIYFNQKFLERGACIFINYILSWFHETYFEWWGISQEGISLCKLCKNLSAARKLEVFNFFAEFLYAVKICCGSSLRITMTCDLEGRWARLKGKQPQQLRHGFQTSERDSTKI